MILKEGNMEIHSDKLSTLLNAIDALTSYTENGPVDNYTLDELINIIRIESDLVRHELEKEEQNETKAKTVPNTGK
jgi:hypothetical protein